MSSRPAKSLRRTHTIHVKLVHNIQQIVKKKLPNKNVKVIITVRLVLWTYWLTTPSDIFVLHCGQLIAVCEISGKDALSLRQAVNAVKLKSCPETQRGWRADIHMTGPEWVLMTSLTREYISLTVSPVTIAGIAYTLSLYKNSHRLKVNRMKTNKTMWCQQ